MSAIDPKKYLQEIKDKHAQICEDMETLRENIDRLSSAFEVAEAIEGELWALIKDVEREIKDDEDYIKILGGKCSFIKE